MPPQAIAVPVLATLLVDKTTIFASLWSGTNLPTEHVKFVANGIQVMRTASTFPYKSGGLNARRVVSLADTFADK